jgi:hypothetical protein
VPNSGRWLSAWPCRSAHDYSRHWATVIDRGSQSRSIAFAD